MAALTGGCCCRQLLTPPVHHDNDLALVARTVPPVPGPGGRGLVGHLEALVNIVGSGRVSAASADSSRVNHTDV